MPPLIRTWATLRDGVSARANGAAQSATAKAMVTSCVTAAAGWAPGPCAAVSYTHLTLPTT